MENNDWVDVTLVALALVIIVLFFCGVLSMPVDVFEVIPW